MTRPTDSMMSQILEVHEAEDLWGADPLAYVNREGTAFLFAGEHTGWAWCWCQPQTVAVPMVCAHGEHLKPVHRGPVS